jgi:CRP-like cAMP-binding protein
MTQERPTGASPSALLTRLSRLGAPSPEAQSILAAAIARANVVRIRREIVGEGDSLGRPRAIVSGWAARVRLLQDGRRQFVSLLIPGDLVGLGGQPDPIASSTVIAITEVAIAPLPDAAAAPGLAAAYAVSAALEKAYLMSQVTRLGRLNAQERIADLLLELSERLTLAGLADIRGFATPLTQEMLADVLGLTPVHVNRMLQMARREGDIEWRPGRVTLVDPEALARKIGRTPVRVSATLPTDY